jgi:beta-alanine--pyruvate transaminase
MGAVVARNEIYQTFMDNAGPEYMPELMHGYTYSAHPVACAAGLAAVDIFEKEGMDKRVAEMAPYFESAVHNLKGLKHVVDIRNFGLAAALQIAPVSGEPGKRPFEISMKCWDKGLYLRFGGDTVQLGPPFISEKEHIDEICNIVSDVIPTIP